MSHVKYKRAYSIQYSTITGYKSLYGRTITIQHKTGENIMVVLHIYGAVEMFLLFCDHQKAESESREMENVVAGPK